jgi:hypothetical protein
MLRRTLKRQAQQVLKTLRVSLANCPENAITFEPGGLGELAMHALGSVEEHFAADGLGAKWSSPVQSKEELLAYLDDARDMLLVPFVEEADLLDEDVEPQFFISKLDRVMKTTRHLAHHTGEIARILKSKGIEPGPFI